MSGKNGENWTQEQIDEYGADFLADVDRLGFGDRGYLVLKILTELASVEGRLLFSVGAIFRQAGNKTSY